MKQHIARLFRKAANRLDPPMVQKISSMNYNIASAAGAAGFASGRQLAAEMRLAQAQRNLDSARQAAR